MSPIGIAVPRHHSDVADLKILRDVFYLSHLELTPARFIASPHSLARF